MNFWELLHKELENHANSERAASQKAYMRGQYEYYGIMAGELSSLLADFNKEHKAANWEELKDQVLWTWEQPEREWQMIGMKYLQKMKKLWGDELLELAKTLVISKSWWDTVDFLASNIVGHYLIKKPELAIEEMTQWNLSGNVWQIRTSIIFQLKYKNTTNADFLSFAILNHLGSKDFFLNKASGWALRQYSRVNPEWVRIFLSAHELSGLTRRVGGKFL